MLEWRVQVRGWMSVDICQFVNAPTPAKFKLLPGRQGTRAGKVRRASLLGCEEQLAVWVRVGEGEQA